MRVAPHGRLCVPFCFPYVQYGTTAVWLQGLNLIGSRGGIDAGKCRAVIHTVFDILAAVASLGVTVLCYRWRLADAAQHIEQAGAGYMLVLVAGAAAGSYGFGSLNLALSGEPMAARSIMGTLAGIPFAVALLIFWLAMRRDRAAKPE